MAAPKGNKNAEKWTEDKAEALIQSIVKYLEKHKNCRTLNGAAVHCGYYGSLLWDLRDKYPENKIVSDSLKRGKAICGNRLAEQALNGDAHATMAIFLLKNNHGMADKVEQKTEHKTEEGGLVVKLGGQDIRF